MQVSGQHVPTFQGIYQLGLFAQILVIDLNVRRNHPQSSNVAFKVRSSQGLRGLCRSRGGRCKRTNGNSSYVFPIEKYTVLIKYSQVWKWCRTLGAHFFDPNVRHRACLRSICVEHSGQLPDFPKPFRRPFPFSTDRVCFCERFLTDHAAKSPFVEKESNLVRSQRNISFFPFSCIMDFYAKIVTSGARFPLCVLYDVDGNTPAHLNILRKYLHIWKIKRYENSLQLLTFFMLLDFYDMLMWHPCVRREN